MLYKLMRPMATLPGNPQTLRQVSGALTRLVNDVEAKIRLLESPRTPLPEILSFDGRQRLSPCIRQTDTPWREVSLPKRSTPGMVSPEECSYYTYIGQFYSGAGELVELGPWLGRSTFYILHGLDQNPNFTDRRLNVFDDFVWRSDWMDDKVAEDERVGHHQDFEGLFRKYSHDLADRLSTQKRKIVTYDGNDDVPQLVWTGEPVEIIYVDCGRTHSANEAWWELFRGSFIPDKTLIVLEDWNTHREVPVKWYNQIKEWVDSKGEAIQLVHELTHGGIATFLYRGIR